LARDICYENFPTSNASADLARGPKDTTTPNSDKNQDRFLGDFDEAILEAGISAID
jgi:hypothetical protein